MQKLLAIMILIYLPGSCITYMILFNQLMAYAVGEFGASQTFVDSMTFRALVGIPATLLLYFPMSLMRDMSAF